MRAGEDLSSSVLWITRSRFTWLFVNLVTAFIASAVIGLFEGQVEKMVALAVLAPIVAGQGGVGVLENLLASVPPSPKGRSDILAWLGPCIGPQAFEVGAEVRAAFCDLNPQADACFVPHTEGKYLADLAGLARQRLQGMGITRIHGNDSQAEWCTVSQTSRFFSHRRDSRFLGQSGRMAACIWLEG